MLSTRTKVNKAMLLLHYEHRMAGKGKTRRWGRESFRMHKHFTAKKLFALSEDNLWISTQNKKWANVTRRFGASGGFQALFEVCLFSVDMYGGVARQSAALQAEANRFIMSRILLWDALASSGLLTQSVIQRWIFITRRRGTRGLSCKQSECLDANWVVYE